MDFDGGIGDQELQQLTAKLKHAGVHNYIRDAKIVKPRDMGVERETWSHKALFLLSCVGFAVGMGNVWRFPYLCYKNGGGAFLIPYLISVFLGGIPIFVMEVAIGQLMSQGGITAWNMCPAFRGIGYATTFACFFLNVYYIVILAWGVHYLYNSFTWELPWASCDHPWTSPDCTTGQSNGTVDAATEYWWNRVLQISKGVDDMNHMQWELVGCLVAVWILVYFCVWKGIKSSGKVVIFTALFPYVVMTVFFVRGVTLDGASDGISYFLKPDFSKLANAGVWLDAGTQVFFSYAIAIGCMTALGSYNKFNHDFLKDCLIISAINSGTSLYVGVAIFSVLGFMAKENGVAIDAVAESGPGLVFIAFPKAMSKMPLAPLWSILFFIMILLMGVDSQFVAVEGFITAVQDCVPTLRRPGRRETFVAVVCFLKFLLGLPLVTDAGVYWFQLMDYYAASGIVLLWICLWQCIAVTYGHGLDQFWHYINLMRGPTVHKWLRYCWAYATPAFTLGILLFMVSTFTRLQYNKSYIYPAWAEAIGLTLAVIPMLMIPGYIVWRLFQAPRGSFRQRWRVATTPGWSKEVEGRLTSAT